MKDILHSDQRAVLVRFCSSKLLLAFDFDGTLAPIVDLPENAWMRPHTAALLEEAAKRYPCIVISGRGRCDVRARLGTAGLLEVLGNHGAEPWAGSAELVETVRGWSEILTPLANQMAGLEIENKVYSLAVHYRRARSRIAARAAIRTAALALCGARLVNGKEVVNVVPSAAPHKGTALERERVRLGCETALYVGDDVTDEDVFALGQPERLLSIRVGARRFSRASYYISSQLQMDDLLEALIEMRREQHK
jgi:trehalose 6-phosphate phosphatase